MPERLHQYRFEGRPKDVTPKGFQGLNWPDRREQESLALSEAARFVWEVKEEFVIRSPGEAADYFMFKVFTPFEQFDQEELWVGLLNTKNRLTHDVLVYRGTINTMYVRAAELYKEAVRLNAPAIFVAHCHPSGDPTPSLDDVRTTYSSIFANSLTAC